MLTSKTSNYQVTSHYRTRRMVKYVCLPVKDKLKMTPQSLVTPPVLQFLKKNHNLAVEFVAQLVEQLLPTPDIPGSNPIYQLENGHGVMDSALARGEWPGFDPSSRKKIYSKGSFFLSGKKDPARRSLVWDRYLHRYQCTKTGYGGRT